MKSKLTIGKPAGHQCRLAAGCDTSNTVADISTPHSPQTRHWVSLTCKVLETINREDSEGDTIQAIAHLIQEYTGIEAVGFRLQDGDDYPYYTTMGFSEEFVEAEKYLCRYDTSGKIIRNSDGNPVLECMCGNIIQGLTDQSLPFFTEDGSFWSNCTTDLLAASTEEDRQSRTRNRCNGEGYESVALIPLTCCGETVGLLQLNDRRKNMFTPDLIELFENLADSIAIVLKRIRTEKKLHKSKNQYMELFNNISSAVAICEATEDSDDFIFKSVNQSFERIEKIKREDLVGKSVLEAFPGVRENGLFDVFQRVCKTGKSEDHAVSIYKDNRVAGWWDNHVYKLPSGEIVALYRDVTALKQAEEQATLERNLAEKYLNIAGTILVAIDSNGQITMLNRKGCEVLECQSEDAIGANWFENFISAKQRENVSTVFKQMMTGDIEPVEYFENEVMTKSGQERIIAWHNTTLKDVSGKIVGTLSSGEDITDRRLTEQALKVSEVNYRDLYDNSPDMFFSVDVKSRNIIRCNNTLSRATGFSVEELLGKPILELYHPDCLNEAQRFFNLFATTGELRDAELQMKRKDGVKIDVGLNISAVRDDQGNINYCRTVCRDITDRKRAERALGVQTSKLKERVKELNCLYGLSLSLRDNNSHLNETLQRAVNLLPQAMRRPEVTAARIIVNKSKYSTSNYRETEWKQTAEINTGDGCIGLVEVVHLAEKPDMDEVTFLKEECHLIDTIALALGQFLERYQAEEKLRETNTRLIKSQMELENKNTALGEIISHVDREKQDTALLIQNNVDRIVQPMLGKLEIGADDTQKNYLSILRSTLDEIISPFINKLEHSMSRLTPRETEISSMVKNGYSSKEIAQALNTSEGTVRNQRKKIRKKLGLTSDKTNLASFLKQI